MISPRGLSCNEIVLCSTARSSSSNDALELDSRLVIIGAEIHEYLEILRNESPNNEMELTPGC